LLVLAFATGTAQSRDLGWHRYSLPDAGASVDVPSALLPVDAGPPEKGAGRMFRSSDGSADLSIYALHNRGQTPAQFLRSQLQLPTSAIIYRRITDDMLTVSGYRGDKIWYARCNFDRDELRCLSINYPTREELRWDPI